jgi:hypothetical protein
VVPSSQENEQPNGPRQALGLAWEDHGPESLAWDIHWPSPGNKRSPGGRPLAKMVGAPMCGMDLSNK